MSSFNYGKINDSVYKIASKLVHEGTLTKSEGKISWIKQFGIRRCVQYCLSKLVGGRYHKEFNNAYQKALLEGYESCLLKRSVATENTDIADQEHDIEVFENTIGKTKVSQDLAGEIHHLKSDYRNRTKENETQRSKESDSSLDDIKDKKADLKALKQFKELSQVVSEKLALADDITLKNIFDHANDYMLLAYKNDDGSIHISHQDKYERMTTPEERLTDLKRFAVFANTETSKAIISDLNEKISSSGDDDEYARITTELSKLHKPFSDYLVEIGGKVYPDITKMLDSPIEAEQAFSKAFELYNQSKL